MSSFVTNKRYTVFSIRKVKNGASNWIRAGSARVNRDGSMNVYLDVLPIDGVLHVRDAAEPEGARRDSLELEPPEGK